MNSKVKVIALSGVMGALTFIMMFLETYVFSILIPIAPPCFLSLSLALTLSLCGNWKYMFLGGTIMGFCSFIIAFIIGNPAFIFPWISILPRIFIGITAFGASRLVLKFTAKKENKFLKNYLPYGVGAAVGVITNTVLTLTMLLLCKFIGVSEMLATFTAINFPIEVVASVFLVPLLVNAVKRFKHEG